MAAVAVLVVVLAAPPPPVARRRPPPAPQLLISFDDGPSAPHVRAVLPVLRRCGLRARWYVSGWRLARPHDRRALVQLVHAGHLLGNHLWSHLAPSYLRLRRALAEFDRTAREIDALLRRARLRRPPGCYYRPPHGDRLRSLETALRARGCRVVLWHVSDYRSTAAGMLGRVRQHIRRGVLRVRVLFHTDARRFLDFVALAERAGLLTCGGRL